MSGVPKAYEKAFALHQAGKLAKAIAEYRRLLRQRPDDPTLLAYAGLACFEAGRLPEARRHLTRKLDVAGDDPEVLNLLGMVESKSGQREAALAAYRRAVAVAPTFVRAWNNMGSEFRAMGALNEARKAFAQVLETDAGNVFAAESLAEVLVDMGDDFTAAALYDDLSRRDPGNAGYHGRIASLTQHTHGPAAEARLRQAIDADPGERKWRYMLGALLSQRGRYDESLEIYHAMLVEAPDDPLALTNRAVNLAFLGRSGEAEAVYRHIWALTPDDPLPLARIAELKTFADGDPDIAALEAFVVRSDLGDTKIRDAAFGLAKAYRHVGDDARSFATLELGNAIQRSALGGYDVAVDVAMLRRIAEVFSPALIAAGRGGGNTNTTPKLFVGIPPPRATFGERVLAGHPQVLAGGENTFVSNTLRAFRLPDDPMLPYPDWVAEMSTADFTAYLDEFAEHYLANLPVRSGDVVHVTDKMPLNFLYLGIIALAFPEAPIVHCVRDPVDTCLSCYQQKFAGDLDFSWDLNDLGHFYVAYRRLMAHWEQAFDTRLLHFSYEDMIADQRGQTEVLLAHCGLSWDDGCLQFYEKAGGIATAS
ncbi:MAG: sulfotransferase [Rhodospirillaceae bacterium]